MSDPLFMREEIIKDIYRARSGEITFSELMARARKYCKLCEQTYKERHPDRKPIKFNPSHVLRNLVP